MVNGISRLQGLFFVVSVSATTTVIIGTGQVNITGGLNATSGDVISVRYNSAGVTLTNTIKGDQTFTSNLTIKRIA